MNSLKKIFPCPDSNFTMLMVGARRSGKSTTIAKLIRDYYSKVFDVIYVIKPARAGDVEDVYDNLPIELYDQYSDDLLQGLIDEHYFVKATVPDTKTLFVLDDCIAEKEFQSGRNDKSQIINEAFIRGRRGGYSMIITTQLYTGVSTVLRVNSDVITYHDRLADRSVLKKEKPFTHDNKKFHQVIDLSTSTPYGYLIISLFDKSCVYYYDSEQKKFFKIILS